MSGSSDKHGSNHKGRCADRAGDLGAAERGRFQGADAVELERYPPKDGRCAAVRHMLRDYADGDLTTGMRASVDRHLEGCRDCSLALARTEHETLKLRDALQPGLREDGSPVTSAPAGFTDRLMARLLTEEGLPTPGDAGRVSGDSTSLVEDVSLGDTAQSLRLPRPDGDPAEGDADTEGESRPPGSRGRSQHAVGREGRVSSRGGAAASGSASGATPRVLRSVHEHRLQLGVLSVLAAAAALFMFWTVWSPSTGANGLQFTVLADAGGAATWSRGGEALPSFGDFRALPGDTVSLPAGEAMTLGLSGPPGVGPRGASVSSQVLVSGPATLSLGESGLRLWSGDLEVEQREGTALLVDFPGGWRSELGAGGARVAVWPTKAPSDLVSAGRSLRGTLEIPVEGGSLARFEPPREVGEPMQVPPGFAVDFGTGVPATLRRVLGADALGSLLGPGSVVAGTGLGGAAELATGRVVDGATGRGVAGALVTLQYELVRDEVVTDAGGWFRSQLHGILERSEGREVLVEVVPPAGGAGGGWAAQLPRPAAVQRVGRSGTVASDSLLGRFQLETGIELKGRVRGASDQVGRFDPSELQLCVAVLDEAVGRLTPLNGWLAGPSRRGLTPQPDGSFVLSGLPSRMLAQQQLVLLISGEGVEPAVIPLGVGSSTAGVSAGAASTSLWLDVAVELRVGPLSDGSNSASDSSSLGAMIRAAEVDPAGRLVLVRGVPGLDPSLCVETVEVSAEMEVPVGYAAGGSVPTTWVWAVDADVWLSFTDDGLARGPAPQPELPEGAIRKGAGQGTVSKGSVALHCRSGVRFGRFASRDVEVGLELRGATAAVTDGATRIFAVPASGQVTYIGTSGTLSGSIEVDASMFLEAPAGSIAKLVAIGGDGSVGCAALAGTIAEGRPVTVELAPGGWIDATALAAPQGFALLRLRALQPGREPTVASSGDVLLRCARAESGWRIADVPAGSWELLGWDGQVVGRAQVTAGLGAVISR